MLIIRPDFGRRIDLPGTGPCPRPVDIDRAQTGFSKLVSLRIYSFAEGMVIDGEAEGDEVFIVLMRGEADVTVDSAGKRIGACPLRTDRGLRAVYLPPHAAYQLTALTDCDIAYARSQPATSQSPEARGFAPSGGRLDVSDHATGMELALASLAAGEQLALAASGGGAPERFLHVRMGDDRAATLAGERLGNWESAVLNDGEHATLTVERGMADILTVSAAAHESGPSKGATAERQ